MLRPRMARRWRRVAPVAPLACLPRLAGRGRGADQLLVFGDSLAAGYGLAQPDGFQAQLAAALQATAAT